MKLFLTLTMVLPILFASAASHAQTPATTLTEKATSVTGIPADKPAVQAVAPAAEPVEKFKIRAWATRDNALYKADEEITFVISVFDKDTKFEKGKKSPLVAGQEIEYTITGDGGLKKAGKITSADKPVEVTSPPLARSGFVLLTMNIYETETDAKGKPSKRSVAEMRAGAGVEPEKITSGAKDPADFDEFWSKSIADMRARTPKITVTPADDYLPEKDREKYAGKVKIFDVRVDDGKLAATGILTMPADAKPGSIAAIAIFGGASSIGAHPAPGQATQYNALVFHMNIHDTKNKIKDRAEVLQMRALPDISGYQFADADNLEKYRMKNVFLRIVRSLDYLKSRPEWNKKTLVTWGPSLGGCQALVGAALDQQVTLCLAGGPAMCDHMGAANNQAAGWPKLLNNSRLKDPEINAKAATNSAYFDMANFARRIKCETVVGVGFIDTVCPPTSVYAMYNNLATTNKRIYNATQGGHGGTYKFDEICAFSAGGRDGRVLEVCNPKENLTCPGNYYR